VARQRPNGQKHGFQGGHAFWTAGLPARRAGGGAGLSVKLRSTGGLQDGDCTWSKPSSRLAPAMGHWVLRAVMKRVRGQGGCTFGLRNKSADHTRHLALTFVLSLDHQRGVRQNLGSQHAVFPCCMSGGGGIVGGLHLGQLSTLSWNGLCCSTECGFCKWTLVAARPLKPQQKQSRCTQENGFTQWYGWTSCKHQDWGPG
jgi:hypothetical protein